MLKRTNLLGRLMLCSLTTALFFIGISRQALAVTPPNLLQKKAVKTKTISVKTPNPDPLELPPLGDAYKFIPPVPTPTNPLQEVHLVLRLRERRVYVYRKDEVQTSYPVAVGKEGWETPTGNFKVIQMIKDPSWEHPWTGEVVPPGPDNPLGTRWIGFWTDGKNVIGFHGTPNPESVGRPASHGCVRMYDKDVQALFEKVAVGTPVIVEP